MVTAVNAFCVVKLLGLDVDVLTQPQGYHVRCFQLET